MAERVGFIGMGTMGLPMAGHLMRAGHDVHVWNRTAGKTPVGWPVADRLQGVADAADIIFLCVNRSEDVLAVTAELLSGLSEGKLVVDHSTIEPVVARRLHTALASHQIGFVDAPITGGSVGAQQGKLTIFCGGSPANIDRARPIMQAYAKGIERVGEVGAGQTAKLANQVAVAGALMALAESLAFASRAGLDPELVRDMISGGAGGSWAFENYGPKMLDGDFRPGFSIDNQLKDLHYAAAVAAEVGAVIPGADLVTRLLRDLQQTGRGSEATTALIEVYRR